MKILYLAIMLLLLVYSEGFSQDTGRWYILKADGYQGYIDSLGNEIFKDRFDILLTHLSDGLVFFKKGSESGFLDENGILAFNWEIPCEFSEGLIYVNKDNQHYYLNKKGEKVIDLKDLAVPEGKEISECGPFLNGLAVVRVQNINHKDTIPIPPDVLYDYNIYPGDWYYGLIDKDKKWVIKPDLDDVCLYIEGNCQIFKDGKAYMINKQGITIFAVNEFITNYTEGFALVRTDSTSYFINRLGRRICDKEFENAYPFSEGRAAVQINDKWGFIDTMGRVVITPQYFSVESFSEGLAFVSLSFTEKGYFLDTYFSGGYIDKSGNIKIPLEKNVEYGYRGFKNGISEGRRFIHTEDNKFSGYYELFYINKRGVKIWSEILMQ